MGICGCINPQAQGCSACNPLAPNSLSFIGYSHLLQSDSLGIRQTTELEKIIKLQLHVANLEIELRDLKDQFNTFSLSIGKKSFNGKKPYKCPVCDGSGRYRLATAISSYDCIDCHSCEGKGIVWS